MLSKPVSKPAKISSWLGHFLMLFAICGGVLATLFFSKFQFGVLKDSLARLPNFDYFLDLTDLWIVALVQSVLIGFAALCTVKKSNGSGKSAMVHGYCIIVYSILAFLYVLAKVLLTTEQTSPTNIDPFYWLQVILELVVSFATMGLSVLLIKQEASMREKDEKEEKSDSDDEDSLKSLLEIEEGIEDKKTRAQTGTLRLLRISKKDAHIILIGFVIMIAVTGADVMQPKYLGDVISGIVISRNSPDFIWAIMMYAVLNVVSLVLGGFRSYLFRLGIARLTKRTRKQLFTSILSQETGFFDQTRTGDIMSRLSADVGSMTDQLSGSLNAFLYHAVKTVGIAIMMFSLSWRLSFVTIAGLPILVAVNKIYGGIYKKLSSDKHDAIAKTSQVAEEAVSNFKTVFSLGGESTELKKYCNGLEKAYKLQIREGKINAIQGWTTRPLSLIFVVASLYYGGHLVMTEQMDNKLLVTFFVYQITLGDCLHIMAWVYTGLMEAVGSSRKVFQMIDRKPKQNRSGPVKPYATKGRIEFRNVRFSYPARKENPILKGVSFTVEPGQVVALVGKSGSGKSSCLALLERFYDPTGGEVLFDGKPVDEYDHSWLHHTIGMVGQEPVLFARSIKDNILFASRHQANDEEIAKIAEMADAAEFIDTLPDKFDTTCGEKGTQMSAGQKQRIAIARALVRKPDVLLLDEATSALDASAEAAVQETLSRAMAGRTVLVVAHRLSTIRNADKIIVMERGKIVETGTHDELVAMDGHYANLVKKQMNLGVIEEPKAE